MVRISKNLPLLLLFYLCYASSTILSGPCREILQKIPHGLVAPRTFTGKGFFKRLPPLALQQKRGNANYSGGSGSDNAKADQNSLEPARSFPLSKRLESEMPIVIDIQPEINAGGNDSETISDNNSSGLKKILPWLAALIGGGIVWELYSHNKNGDESLKDQKKDDAGRAKKKRDVNVNVNVYNNDSNKILPTPSNNPSTPVTPPVTPPAQPPVTPPVTPPVQPPVTPPVQPSQDSSSSFPSPLLCGVAAGSAVFAVCAVTSYVASGNCFNV